jgi:peptidoglycan/xylan/chitin deacetylase (PgdA/CDA1 family)
MQAHVQPHVADPSIKGKLRRRLARLRRRRIAHFKLDRPLVSISFDDAPASAAEAGAAVLEARGARGTYFVCSALAGRDAPTGPNATAEDIQRLMAAGHEIGCHTRTHLDCGEASAEWIDEDVTKNHQALGELGAPAPTSFAYPYGDVSTRAKRVLGDRFALMRGLHHGLICDGCDLNQAPAVGVEGPGGEAVAARWLELALARKAWLILYTHDVSDHPTQWGCTPAALCRLIDRAVQGGAEIVSVREGCKRIGALSPKPRRAKPPKAGSLSGTAGARYARG